MQPGHAKSVTQSRLPSLDGWRAVSIAMVLGSHSTFVYGFPDKLTPFFYWAFDGNLGVRCFFTISGLLITWLMIVENDQTGRVNLRHFYVRRSFPDTPRLLWLSPYAWAASMVHSLRVK